MKSIFGNKKEEAKTKDSEFLSEFQKTLEKSIREEKTQVLMTKKLQSKLKDMVKVLLNNGYSIDEVNMFVNTDKKYSLKDGDIVDD